MTIENDDQLSMDDQIAADWDAILDRQEAEIEPDKEAAEKPDTAAVKEDRARDEQGKFAKVEKETPVEQVKNIDPNTVKAETAQPTTVQAVNDAPQEQARDINRAPSTWKPVARAEWDKLSPEIRAEIHRREGDFQNGQAQLLPDARLGSDLRKVSAPYQMLIESQYGTADKAMGSFLQTAAALQMGSPQQRLQTIVGIAQQFGVDLSALAQPGSPQQQAPSQPLHDPRVDQLFAYQQNQEQLRQQQEQRAIEASAANWVNQKDAQGNPLHPYIGDVLNDLAVWIPSIQQANPYMTHSQILDEAYNRAIWANPDVRPVLQGQQQSELLQRNTLANQERVQSAKRAASVNVSRRGSIPSPAKPGSIDETLAETARELGFFT